MNCIAWIALLFGTAPAQGNGAEFSAALEPAEIIKKAEAALKDTQTVRYRFEQRGRTPEDDQVPRVDGEVILSGYRNFLVEKFRLDVKVRPPDKEESVLKAGADGSIVYLFDVPNKKVYADMDPAVMGSQYKVIGDLMLAGLVSPDPFEYEKKAEKIEYRGRVPVEKEECDSVGFVIGGGWGEIVWFFGKKDSLPRRVDWVFKTPEGKMEGKSTVIRDLQRNPSLPPDVFKLVVPEGFTRTDDFAP